MARLGYIDSVLDRFPDPTFNSTLGQIAPPECVPESTFGEEDDTSDDEESLLGNPMLANGSHEF